MVHGKPSHIGRPIGEKFTGLGRCPQQMGAGQGGLHLKQKTFSLPAKDNGPVHHANSGHVCVPWKPPIRRFCVQTPSLASPGGGCPKVSIAGHKRLLCKPSWKIISPWLHRVRENKHERCMLIVPFWVSSTWWPQILKRHVRGDPSISEKNPFTGCSKIVGEN